MADKKNKPTPKKPKFNAWWIYTALILVFLGINYFGSGSGFGEPAKTTPDKFEAYAAAGDVKKVEIVNKIMARVYLTDEAKKKDVHSKAENKGFLPGAGGADYEFQFGDLQIFQNRVHEIEQESNIKIPLSFESESNFMGELLLTLLPIAVIIGIWIFIMRRMSSGAGGGAGGQIFNIGKSKAKLLNEAVGKVTFDDVAGIDEALEIGTDFLLGES